MNTDLDIKDCNMIWSAVLAQAFRDASYGLYKKHRNGTINIKKSLWHPPAGYLPHSREAQLWLLDPGLDFEDVCSFLQLSPEAVHEQAMEMFKGLNKHLPKKYIIRDIDDSVIR